MCMKHTYLQGHTIPALLKDYDCLHWTLTNYLFIYKDHTAKIINMHKANFIRDLKIHSRDMVRKLTLLLEKRSSSSCTYPHTGRSFITGQIRPIYLTERRMMVSSFVLQGGVNIQYIILNNSNPNDSQWVLISSIHIDFFLLIIDMYYSTNESESSAEDGPKKVYWCSSQRGKKSAWWDARFVLLVLYALNWLYWDRLSWQ